MVGGLISGEQSDNGGRETGPTYHKEDHVKIERKKITDRLHCVKVHNNRHNQTVIVTRRGVSPAPLAYYKTVYKKNKASLIYRIIYTLRCWFSMRDFKGEIRRIL